MIRQAVGAIVYRDDLYLLIHKTKINTKEGKLDIAGEWDFIKGGVEEVDDSLESAILRELEEETGSTEFVIMMQFKDKISFHFPEHIQAKIGYKQQETTMFLVNYLGDLENICPRDDEIIDYQFLRKEEVLNKLTHEDTRQFFIKNLSEQSTK